MHDPLSDMVNCYVSQWGWNFHFVLWWNSRQQPLCSFLLFIPVRPGCNCVFGQSYSTYFVCVYVCFSWVFVNFAKQMNIILINMHTVCPRIMNSWMRMGTVEFLQGFYVPSKKTAFFFLHVPRQAWKLRKISCAQEKKGARPVCQFYQPLLKLREKDPLPS